MTIDELETEVTRLRQELHDRIEAEAAAGRRVAFLTERYEILTNRFDSDRSELAALGKSVRWLLGLARREGVEP